MRERTVRLIWIGLIVAAAAAVLHFMPLRQGLDLKGGVHVRLEARPGEDRFIDDEAMARTAAVIERRINALGVTEPTIQRQGPNRIIVELPGVEDQDQAIDTIGRTALLEFKDPLGNTVFTGEHLLSAQLTQEQGRWAVAVDFDAEGARLFAQLTARYANLEPLPIVLDGEVLVAPVPREAITRGSAVISGNFTLEEARQLAILLQSGALPVPLEVVEIRNVGPTLGRESIEQSIWAGVVGFALVVVFLTAYYRMAGLVASAALAVYALLVFAALALLRATLTLPGIAGLILSIGMAVDANVLIFERVKEEIRAGNRLREAIRLGWSRAFRTILDANITTLMTALILFYLGTGPVRGFAVTLSIGLLISMFTAVVVTRWLLQNLVDARPDRLDLYFGVREESAT